MHFGYKKLYIDGNLRDAQGAAREPQICPANGESVADLAWANTTDCKAALEAARNSFPAWSALSLQQRESWMLRLRDALRSRGDELRSAVMYEMGKPWAATEEDLNSLLDALAYFPKAMEQMDDVEIPDIDRSFTHRIVSRPVGVVVAILSWNFPLLNIGFKLGPALAAGCTIVIKPSKSSALSAYILGEIAASIALPRGVLNILCGPVEEIGVALTSSRIPRLLTMIGSSAAGKKLLVQGSTSVKRSSMELGGNAPALVFDDADVEMAAKELASIKFGNAGQICVSPNRIYVQESVMPRFLDALLREAKAVRVGFGRDSGATMGPLIHERARERVNILVQEAVAEGASLLLGGVIPEGLAAGSFYCPTILGNVKDSMRISREEVFGPVAALHTFTSEEEVLRSANDTEFGLVAYAYTSDQLRAERLAAALDFGEVMLNGFKWGIDLPHGGIKESGFGKDCSTLALDDYLVKVRVTSRRTEAEPVKK